MREREREKDEGIKTIRPDNLFIVPTFPAHPFQIALDDDPWNNIDPRIATYYIAANYRIAS